MESLRVKSVYEYLKQSKIALKKLAVRASEGPVAGFTPPSTLVGEYNYPKVRIGLMFTTDTNASLYDAPKYWASNGYRVSDILRLRGSLLNSINVMNVKEDNNKKLRDIQFAVMSSSEVDVELKLKGLTFSPYTSRLEMPYNISGVMDSFKLSDNVKIDRPIERVYYDRDLKATEGMKKLYMNGIDENKISKILSTGAIGVKRKLVPTRWAITAVDDSIGKDLLKEVKDLDTSDFYGTKRGGILGNMFTFLFLKGEWSFELIEVWNRDGKRAMIGEGDYELYGGRKTYVKNTAGAYYAVRLAVLEKLKKLKKQSKVIAVREITPDYFVPLGVWVVRESARAALSGQINQFTDFQSALASANDSTLYLKDIENSSKVISITKKQALLSSFI